MCDLGGNWISISTALLTPTIAIVAAGIAFLQWRTNDLKRNNELFDRRYEFYQRLRGAWLSTVDSDLDIDMEDLISWAEEAEFLFGRDISTFILSLDGKSHEGHPFFPNQEFIDPFKKYMSLR